ncbi:MULTISPECIES: hypothetical protein [unclassified Moorena]|uniref:hypothetical protein n=1 Tax=unclassified Moorena TaxID=2683338 RepID=UPI001400878A|nr:MULTISPECIES: hypothetical protein [unclassified Moorena]NEO13916.1 hypothetical protein [Moorena sp. SIO3E8]NEQ00334.1 hypothetical protein [Moorena sp. SIO3F7]
MGYAQAARTAISVSGISYQLSAISIQLSAISYQLSAFSIQLMDHSVVRTAWPKAKACATVLF